jgi:serine/threonine protein kinase
MSSLPSSSPLSPPPAPTLEVLTTRIDTMAALRKRLPSEHRMVGEALGDVAAAAGHVLASSPGEDARRALGATLDGVDAFQTTFRLEVVVLRFACIRRMFEQLDAILGLIHEAETQAGTGESGALKLWHDRLVVARGEEEKELSVIAKRSTMPFARNTKGHEAMEALTLMKFEIDFYPPPRNSRLHVASMKAIFFSIVRSSNGRVTKIPPWFSPGYMVVSEQMVAIDGNSGLATCTRAKWADRHHGDKIEDVVLKRLPLDAEGIELFRREVERWYAVDSPYVLKMYAACHCSDPTLLVLEDASQWTLYAFVRINAAHRLLVWSKAREAALGLLHLKEKHGTVHGNLKRSNILVAADGTAKVSDFGGGIVTMQNLANQHKEWGADAIQWRAPEFRSYRRRPTYQADVFSLGMCILDAIMDGFELPTAEQLKQKNGVDRPSGLSDQACDLIKGMTAFQPEDRTALPRVIQLLEELAMNPSAHFV